MGIQNLISRLNDTALLRTQAYVNGEWVDGDEGTFNVTDPATGDVVAQVADLSRAQVSAAIEYAQSAQKAWAKLAAKERSQVLRKWFDLMMAAQEDLAIILTAEMGKPLAEARGERVVHAMVVGKEERLASTRVGALQERGLQPRLPLVVDVQ